jgi:hypothetical protein
MNKMHGSEGSQQAINLIEEQLHALAVSIALASRESSGAMIDSGLSQLKRKSRPHSTGSGGNIASDDAHHAISGRNPFEKNHYVRIVIGNALLVVRLFLIEHEMATMRTPEIQFLGHVCDAVLNENTFDIDPGYIPIATFDGLTISSELSGTPLFGDGVNEGFMEFGDAAALLQWLVRFLSGEQHFVTGGDAG